ncbi:MAG: NAD-dependent epimerase/dehydratase family protein [Rhodospirillaceae bacterium]
MMESTTTVLVTGGAGYIGSNVVLALRASGFTVVVIDDLSTGQSWLLPPEVTLVCGDVGDCALLDRVLPGYGVSAVMHFAGSIVVPDSITDPIGYYRNNTANSLTLIGACARDYIHVTDLAAAHVKALCYLMSGGASITLNCGYGCGASVREVIAGVERALGRPLPQAELPRRPGDAAILVAASDRIRQVLDWHPRLDDLDLIIASALNWERSLLAKRQPVTGH